MNRWPPAHALDLGSLRRCKYIEDRMPGALSAQSCRVPGSNQSVCPLTARDGADVPISGPWCPWVNKHGPWAPNRCSSPIILPSTSEAARHHNHLRISSDGSSTHPFAAFQIVPTKKGAQYTALQSLKQPALWYQRRVSPGWRHTSSAKCHIKFGAEWQSTIARTWTAHYPPCRIFHHFTVSESVGSILHIQPSQRFLPHPLTIQLRFHFIDSDSNSS
ncbi:hypothetical protein B0T10DRAFT_91909 [Thelonectria olida]|uniref:Uncharacterized protein n=1 Tax=Thelonectria olida TaxID=1576542 RepID=A0A9P8W289_9HYPO|nr:hypothetical protein B0T10DRAFT_91909 [Thelonectria olida]